MNKKPIFWIALSALMLTGCGGEAVASSLDSVADSSTSSTKKNTLSSVLESFDKNLHAKVSFNLLTTDNKVPTIDMDYVEKGVFMDYNNFPESYVDGGFLNDDDGKVRAWDLIETERFIAPNEAHEAPASTESTIEENLALAAELENDTVSEGYYLSVGYITEIVTKYDSSTGLISFVFADTKGGKQGIVVADIEVDAAEQKNIKTGAKVIVVGKLSNRLVENEKAKDDEDKYKNVFEMVDCTYVGRVTSDDYASVHGDPVKNLNGDEVADFRDAYYDPSYISAHLADFTRENVFIPRIKGSTYGTFELFGTVYESEVGGHTSEELASDAEIEEEHSGRVVQDNTEILATLAKCLGAYDTPFSSGGDLVLNSADFYFAESGSIFTFNFYFTYANGFEKMIARVNISQIGQVGVKAIDNYLDPDFVVYDPANFVIV